MLHASERAAAAEAVDFYAPGGQLCVAWVQGSLARGLTNGADLDLVIVWPAAVPSAEHRTRWHYDSGDFHLDRMTVESRPVDVLHRTVADIEALVGDIERGDVWGTGTLERLPAAAGLVDAVVVDGDESRWLAWRSRLEPIPAAARGELRRVTAGNRERTLAELAAAADREDEFAFEAQLVAALDRHVLPTVFALLGGCYPGRKWTRPLLERLGPPPALRSAVHRAMGLAHSPAHRLHALVELYEWMEATASPAEA